MTYSVRTWDPELETYTPQVGLSVPSNGLTLHQLRRALKELRGLGYTAHRRRQTNGEHDDNDFCVLVERCDQAISRWEAVV